MNVLVTGGLGFIGSHTVVELLNKNYNVIVADNLCNSKITVIDRIKSITNKSFTFYKVDVCNQDEMGLIFQKENIDYILHFAALKSNADSIKHPGVYYANNIQSSFVLMCLMEKYNVNKLIYSSSATVYGNCKNVPIKETEVIGDVISPYGMSKYLNELYFQHKATSKDDMKIISLRYFNPIGAHPSGLLGEDSPDAIPNNLMLYLGEVAKGRFPYLNVFGGDYNTPDGSGIRDYIHVVDLAKGHIAAMEYLNVMENNYDVFNLGTGSGHTVFEVINLFKNVNKVDLPYKVGPRRPGDVEISYASVDKANKLLKWKAEHSLRDCLVDFWRFELKK